MTANWNTGKPINSCQYYADKNTHLCLDLLKAQTLVQCLPQFLVLPRALALLSFVYALVTKLRRFLTSVGQCIKVSNGTRSPFFSQARFIDSTTDIYSADNSFRVARGRWSSLRESIADGFGLLLELL